MICHAFILQPDLSCLVFNLNFYTLYDLSLLVLQSSGQGSLAINKSHTQQLFFKKFITTL